MSTVTGPRTDTRFNRALVSPAMMVVLPFVLLGLWLFCLWQEFTFYALPVTFRVFVPAAGWIPYLIAKTRERDTKARQVWTRITIVFITAVWLVAGISALLGMAIGTDGSPRITGTPRASQATTTSTAPATSSPTSSPTTTASIPSPTPAPVVTRTTRPTPTPAPVVTPTKPKPTKTSQPPVPPPVVAPAPAPAPAPQPAPVAPAPPPVVPAPPSQSECNGPCYNDNPLK